MDFLGKTPPAPGCRTTIACWRCRLLGVLGSADEPSANELGGQHSRVRVMQVA
jgi:hypothetical protein